MHAGLLKPTGLYGKLPATGDFVALGLDAGFRQHLDRWISMKVLPVIEAGLFPDEGLRFLVPAAHAAGAMIDSRDSAGRRYPLVGLASATGAGATACDTWTADALAVLAAARDTRQAPREVLDALAELAPIPQATEDATGPLAVWTVDKPPAGSLVELLGLEVERD